MSNLSKLFRIDEEEKTGLQVIDKPETGTITNVIGAKPTQITQAKSNLSNLFKKVVTAPSRFTAGGFGLFTKAIPQATVATLDFIDRMGKGGAIALSAPIAIEAKRAVTKEPREKIIKDYLQYMKDNFSGRSDFIEESAKIISKSNMSLPEKIISATGLGAAQFGNPAYFIPIERLFGAIAKIGITKKTLTAIERESLRKIFTGSPGGKNLSSELVDEIIAYPNKRELLDMAKKGELFAKEIRARKGFEGFVKDNIELQFGKAKSLLNEAGFAKLPAKKEISNLSNLFDSQKGGARGVVAVGAESLIQEAKKYKTAEEFVKAQGTPVYHGTYEKGAINFDKSKLGANKPDFLSSLGFHFTPDKKMADNLFAYDYGGKGQGQTIEAVLNIKKPLKITETDLVKDIIRYGKEKGTIPKSTADELLKRPLWGKTTDIKDITHYIYRVSKQSPEKARFNIKRVARDYLENLKKQGYDGIQYKNEIEWAGDHRYDFIAFEPEQIKTKSQLIDIWNKAQEVKPKPPTGKEQLAEREKIRFERTQLKEQKELLKYPDEELENQYQNFKKLKVKDAEDAAQLKVKNKAEANEIDNILYSQEKTADEILDMFKERYTKERVPLPVLPKETKAVVAEKARQQVKTAKEILDRRRSFITAVKKQFELTDSDIRAISRKDIRFMDNFEFKKFIDDLRTRAEGYAERKTAENILRQQIQDKELDIEPLRKAMKLPKIENMTIKQLQDLDELLQPYLHGDVFLSQRKLETINRTELEGIRTYREARERLSKKLNIPVEQLENIRVSEFDKLRGDSALAERNPFYKMMVEETARVRLKRDTEYYEMEKVTNELANKLKTTITQKLIPQQKNIRAWFESKDKTDVTLTKEELSLVEFMQDMWIEARDYLIEMEAMKKGINKDNYFTHIRRTTLEAVKEDGIIQAAKEMYKQYKLDELQFNILDEQTGDVMALDKFFRFALKRTGELKPTENIVRSFLTYMRTFKKKQALDEIVPLIDIYANALTPKGTTKTGVLLHGNLIRFTKQWLNTQKGRHVTLLAKQGGKIDLALRALKTFTSLLDLGLNVPVSLASQIGEQAVTFKLSGNKRYILGKTRALTKQGKAITKKYTNLIGKNPWQELVEPAKDITNRFSSAIFSMFADANWRRNRNVLLGSMTKEEFVAGEISSQKLAELRTHIGRYGMIGDAKSVIGATPEGRVFTQYKSWALPILRSELKNITNLLKLFSKDKKAGKDALYQLGLTAEITGAVLIIKALLGDDEDDSFIGKMKIRAYNEAMTIIQAMNPNLLFSIPRIQTFLSDLTSSLKTIILLEEYKTSGPGYKEGDLKGLNQLQKQLTPRAIKQFESTGESKTGSRFNRNATRTGARFTR